MLPLCSTDSPSHGHIIANRYQNIQINIIWGTLRIAQTHAICRNCLSAHMLCSCLLKSWLYNGTQVVNELTVMIFNVQNPFPSVTGYTTQQWKCCSQLTHWVVGHTELALVIFCQIQCYQTFWVFSGDYPVKPASTGLSVFWCFFTIVFFIYILVMILTSLKLSLVFSFASWQTTPQT